MKIKYCLVGIALLAMPDQVHGWGFFLNLIRSIANIFAPPPPVPAPAPPPVPKPTPAPAPTPKVVKTKTIMMRTNIMPTWEELAPVSAVKIKLGRVADYWSDLRESDLNTYSALFTAAAAKEVATTKIQTYYAAATKCLSEQPLTTPNPPEAFKVRIDSVSACVAKAEIPKFVVEETNMVAPKMSMYVPGNHLDPDDYAPPPPTEVPTLAPVLELTPASALHLQTHNKDLSSISMSSDAIISTPSPWIFDLPGHNGAGVPPLELISDTILEMPTVSPMPKILGPDVPGWMHKADLHPKIAALPDFRTLDADNDGLMSSEEWIGYVNSLSSIAREAIKKANDKQGLEYMQKIIAHHYKQLANCVTSVSGEAKEKALDAAQFQALAPSIDTYCDVKFRYSLLAGPPPFEWVAGHRTTVTAEHVSNWLARELEIANKRSTPVPAPVLQFVGCLEQSLLANKRELVNRTKFYATIASCSDRS